MKLVFLGAGSAFTVGEDNYNSNLILQLNDKNNLLIDCGVDIRHSLHDIGMNYTNISDVYISHLHADHAGGLEWLAFSTYFNESISKPHLYISEMLVNELWENVLKGGLGSLQSEIATLDTYFDVHSIKLNSSFIWEDIDFKLVQMLHTMNGYQLVPCFGLFFEINNTKIFFTADTQFCPNLLIPFYEKADVIFQDCQTAATELGVHAQYDELNHLPKSIKKKMWLYHYNPGKTQQPEKDGFKGFVEKGQCFDF